MTTLIPQTPPSAVEFDSFRRAYFAGAREIKSFQAMKSNFSKENYNTRLQSLARNHLEALKGTAYGVALKDSNLPKVLDDLETSLAEMIASMIALQRDLADRDPIANDIVETPEKTVRAFHFWGRIGGVFNRYREIGHPVSREEFNVMTSRINDHAQNLIDVLEPNLLLGILQTVYSKNTITALEKTLDLLYQIKKPVTELQSENRLNRDLFRDDFRAIPRQFISAAAFICFELFGHVKVRHLHQLLDIKIDTAVYLGYAHWDCICRDGLVCKMKDTDRDLRDRIRKIGLKVEGVARKKAWSMKPVIEFANCLNTA